ncbi:autophagy protein APG9, putative [Eimeria maxima]|uniref:Autophagy protein APG9, putative n=1 Tax=Eimeria maxima TaxID=5804 RepID=U6MHX9_EIMMA|nr:autophagy protein APG9, putative [Eimeria maxima]CDJ61260.1 autophagy protein APG9, putative [Eimeria maxima]
MIVATIIITPVSIRRVSSSSSGSGSGSGIGGGGSIATVGTSRSSIITGVDPHVSVAAVALAGGGGASVVVSAAAGAAVSAAAAAAGASHLLDWYLEGNLCSTGHFIQSYGSQDYTPPPFLLQQQQQQQEQQEQQEQPRQQRHQQQQHEEEEIEACRHAEVEIGARESSSIEGISAPSSWRRQIEEEAADAAAWVHLAPAVHTPQGRRPPVIPMLQRFMPANGKLEKSALSFLLTYRIAAPHDDTSPLWAVLASRKLTRSLMAASAKHIGAGGTPSSSSCVPLCCSSSPRDRSRSCCLGAQREPLINWGAPPSAVALLRGLEAFHDYLLQQQPFLLQELPACLTQLRGSGSHRFSPPAAAAAAAAGAAAGGGAAAPTAWGPLHAACGPRPISDEERGAYFFWLEKLYEFNSGRVLFATNQLNFFTRALFKQTHLQDPTTTAATRSSSNSSSSSSSTSGKRAWGEVPRAPPCRHNNRTATKHSSRRSKMNRDNNCRMDNNSSNSSRSNSKCCSDTSSNSEDGHPYYRMHHKHHGVRLEHHRHQHHQHLQQHQQEQNHRHFASHVQHQQEQQCSPSHHADIHKGYYPRSNQSIPHQQGDTHDDQQQMQQQQHLQQQHQQHQQVVPIFPPTGDSQTAQLDKQVEPDMHPCTLDRGPTESSSSISSRRSSSGGYQYSSTPASQHQRLTVQQQVLLQRLLQQQQLMHQQHQQHQDQLHQQLQHQQRLQQQQHCGVEIFDGGEKDELMQLLQQQQQQQQEQDSILQGLQQQMQSRPPGRRISEQEHLYHLQQQQQLQQQQLQEQKLVQQQLLQKQHDIEQHGGNPAQWE